MTREEDLEWRLRWPAIVTEMRTDESASLVRRYYSTLADGKPAYSGSQFEIVAALNPDPYSIGPADFTAVSMLSVAIPARAAIRLLGPDASEITALLRQIPIDRTIIEEIPGRLALGSPPSRLWKLLRSGRDGVGPTITSKLLAVKRPHLIPIWDSYVKEATGLATRDNWHSFRNVLVADDQSIWKWLSDVRAAVETVPEIVSNLRLLDIILWMSVDQRRRSETASGP